MIEWGLVRLLKPFLIQVTWPRLSRGYIRDSSPLSFPWFQFFLTIRNMPPLAFGIPNEQYSCDMAII